MVVFKPAQEDPRDLILEPCPFCPDGGDLYKDVGVFSNRYREDRGEWVMGYSPFVMCRQCGLKLQLHGFSCEHTADAAITAAWNTRCSPVSVDGALYKYSCHSCLFGHKALDICASQPSESVCLVSSDPYYCEPYYLSKDLMMRIEWGAKHLANTIIAGHDKPDDWDQLIKSCREYLYKTTIISLLEDPQSVGDEDIVRAGDCIAKDLCQRPANATPPAPRKERGVAPDGADIPPWFRGPAHTGITNS